MKQNVQPVASSARAKDTDAAANTIDNGIWRQKELELSVLCSVWSGWEGPGTGGDRAGGRKQETLDKSHLP